MQSLKVVANIYSWEYMIRYTNICT